MSCVREGSLEPPYHPPHAEHGKHGEGRTGRFFRGLRRMFKRRGSASRQADASPDPKSRSTSELLDSERHSRKKEGAYGSGLSVSHDSVFTGERSGDESSDDRPTPGHGLGHISSSHRAELVAAVRRRGRGDGSDDDEDLGLPRSPPASPPTDKADKRHHAGISQSSCSDGSLLSVGSSEMDEDSSSGTHHHSGHDHSNRSDLSDLYSSSEPPTGVAPLSHSAAKHKMAVRPRRTHGAPRRKRNNPIAANVLPITPELNEEMIRSATPDVTNKTSEVVTDSFSSSTITKHHVIVKEHQQLNKELQKTLNVTPNETKLKSSSLPPGLALSQLVGHTPTKLTIAEADTPRSSIKRSKSSSQGKSLRDDSPNPTYTCSSESHIHPYSGVSYHTDSKYVDDSCLTDKKSKSDKKSENEAIKSNKKEESFFSRLLLRKSGKKSKKDQIEGEGQHDSKKCKTDRNVAAPQYKSVDTERPSGFTFGEYSQQKGADKSCPKTTGQRVFSNQMHKRFDNKGAYVQEGMYKDAYSAAKVPGLDYNITDLKIAEETDKMLNLDIKNNYRREERESYVEKVPERTKRSSSKETVDEGHNRDPYIHHEKPKKAQSNVQRVTDAFSTKAFITNERSNITREDSLISPGLINSEEEQPIRAPRLRSVHNDYAFHSGSMPKNIPYFNPNINVSASASPPKSILHQSSENVKLFNRSTEHMDRTIITERSKRAESSQHNFQNVVGKTDSQETYVNSGLRSLGDEYVETRSSIGKSHSFRYASETNSISSQESQMPSLPAIVGISEPLLESWEVNYRRSVIQNSRMFNNRHDFSEKVSTRNFNLNLECNYDSLPSTDSSSYLDSLKTDNQSDSERKPLFTNNIHIKVDTQKRDDISQIEAKIDDIISSPKPMITPILKSSSLDSVKSTPEKPMDERRKTVSVESALSQSGKLINSTAFCKERQNAKHDIDNFISVTHLNKEPITSSEKIIDLPKIVKSEEKQQKSVGVTGVPEFLKIQLNKVDVKPTSNIVLTANITPKKLDTQHYQTDVRDEEYDSLEEKPINNNQYQAYKKLENGIHINNEIINGDNMSPYKSTENMAVIKGVIEKSPNQQTPPSPSTPKTFFKRKSTSIELQDKSGKPRTNSMSTEGSNEKIYDNISMDRKSHSSFGSKSSIQSIDSNEPRTPDKPEDVVVFRKKPVIGRERGEKRNDDEPELMKVFARRSLKLKDSEADILSQEIAEANNIKEELVDNITATKSKTLKNEFNASIKSRDSDKENEDIAPKEHNVEEKRLVDIAARVSQFGVPHYQRSVSITSVSSASANPKRESAPACQKSEVNKYKKEISDSTPEKRLRNRTFPDSSNDREDMKGIAVKNELGFKADTLSKRPWQKKEDDNKKGPLRPLEVKDKNQKNENAVIDKEEEKGKEDEQKEKECSEGEADGSPQFKGILQMRAEWERRAKQGMTK